MRRFVLIPILLSAACGGGDSPPTENPGSNNPNAVSSVSVTGPGTVAFGGTASLSATARNAAGTAVNATFTWTSTATSVATVSSAGVVTGVGEGSATITATAGGVAGTRTVIVQPPIATVTITAPPTLGIGRTQQFAAVARSSGNTQLPATFSWNSSAPNIATVNSSGLVTAVGVGVATISATASGVVGTHQLTVEIASLNAIVETIRAQHGMPAMTGAIVTRTAGAIALGVAGNRRIGGTPATINDKWHLGSNLKGITGALAGIAVKKGVINWNTTVESMFPELGAAIRTEYRSATLRELLSMQAGIRNDPPAGTYAGATPRAQREAASAWGLAAEPQNARGVYYYSNIAYVIAAAMIERAMSGTYESLVVSEIGTPVGATQIGFGPQAAAGANDQPVPHTWIGGWTACEACDNPPGLSAAGRAHMSISDWARITHELLKADAGQSQILDQVNARIIFSNIVSDYGIGWNMTTRSWGGRTAMHTGSNLSNHSVAWLGLDNGVAFLAATNASDMNVQGTRSADALEALVSRMLTYFQTGQ